MIHRYNTIFRNYNYSSFTPYYVQEISLTMSSLLDTMGIAWRAKLSVATLLSGYSVLSSSLAS